MLSSALTLFATGCASTSTFYAYPNKINPLINDIMLHRPIDLTQSLLSESRGNDSILYNMERGRIAQVLGKTDVSMNDFAAAIEKIRENDLQTKINASSIGANVAATLVNDNAIPYKGEGYERVLLHHYQALNYLKKMDLEGAGVEVRRANAEQEEALKRHEEELQDVENEAESRRVGNLLDNPEVIRKYAQLDEVAGRVKNSFQNAYTFYLSGFIYELLDQPNDAYIDYKKGLEIFPENSFLQRDVIRLAKSLDMGEDLDVLKKRFRIEPPTSQNEEIEQGELLVLFEDGFAPQKREIKIPLPIPKAGIVAIAFPIYYEKIQPEIPLHITAGRKTIGSTEPICDMRALALRAIKEQVPAIVIRQVIRAAVKGVNTKLSRDKLGPLGEIFTFIWNIVSENADLRSWITLPANAQILRATLPAGSHRLALNYGNGHNPAYVDVDIGAQGKAVLHVIRAGEQFYISTTVFNKDNPL